MHTSKDVTTRSMTPRRSVRDYIKLPDWSPFSRAPKRPPSPLVEDRPGKMRKECSGGGCPNGRVVVEIIDDEPHGDGGLVVAGKSGEVNGSVTDMPMGPVEGGGVSKADLNGVLHKEPAPPEGNGNAAPKTPRSPTDRSGPSVNGGGGQGGAGSSMKQPVVLDEGYASFDSNQFSAPKNLDEINDREWSDQIVQTKQAVGDDDVEELTFPASRAKVVKMTTGEGGDRKQMLEKAQEDAAIQQVNTLFNGYTARAQKWKAERENFGVQSMFPTRGAIPHTQSKEVNTTNVTLLEILATEARERSEMQSKPPEGRAVGGQEFSQEDSVPHHWAAGAEKRKALAIEKPRSARLEEGKDKMKAWTLPQEAEHTRLAKEKHDLEQHKLAEECLAAENAQLAKSKHDREQTRLRKEREVNERGSLLTGTSGMQKAKAANKEKSGKKVKLSKISDDGLITAELGMIAEQQEVERKKKEKEDVAAKIKQEADKQASLKRRIANEATRRVERRKLEEQKKTKYPVGVVQPLVQVKVENTSSDDAARSMLDRDRSATQPAAEGSRDRRLQNNADQKRKIVGQRLFEASKGDQKGVNLSLAANEDVAPISDGMMSNDVITLAKELHLAKQSLERSRIQKELLEVEVEKRRIDAEATALKRRANGEEAEDNRILKRARSDEGDTQADKPKVGQRHTPWVQDDTDSYDAELQNQGRNPPMTPEERKISRKMAAKKYTLKKNAEKDMSKSQNELGGTPRSTGSHQSQVSFTESEKDEGDRSREDLPMVLQALLSSDLSPDDQAKSRKDNENAKIREGQKPTKEQKQDRRLKSNTHPRTSDQTRDDRIHKQKISGRAAIEEKENGIRTALARFGAPQTSQACDLEETGGDEAYKVDNPQDQDSEHTVSSDEDEGENQGPRSAQTLKLSGPHQIPDEPAAAQPSQPRPTYARKTVPKEVLLRMDEEEEDHEIHAEEDDSGIGRSNYQEERVNEMVWEYQVTRREWLNDEDPTEAEETIYGPYWSKEQANNVAAMEVHREYRNVKVLSPMDFNMTIDAIGMKTHSISSKGGSITTAVDQTLIPPNRARGPMSKKSWLSPKMFVALEKMSLEGAEAGHANPIKQNEEAVSTRILGVFTVLDLANREASRCALEHRTSQLSESQLHQIKKSEEAMKVRERLEELDLLCLTFKSSCALSDGSGVVETWVEVHSLVGPRN